MPCTEWKYKARARIYRAKVQNCGVSAGKRVTIGARGHKDPVNRVDRDLTIVESLA